MTTAALWRNQRPDSFISSVKGLKSFKIIQLAKDKSRKLIGYFETWDDMQTALNTPSTWNNIVLHWKKHDSISQPKNSSSRDFLSTKKKKDSRKSSDNEKTKKSSKKSTQDKSKKQKSSKKKDKSRDKSKAKILAELIGLLRNLF